MLGSKLRKRPYLRKMDKTMTSGILITEGLI
jgi:hypothetical protein